MGAGTRPQTLQPGHHSAPLPRGQLAGDEDSGAAQEGERDAHPGQQRLPLQGQLLPEARQKGRKAERLTRALLLQPVERRPRSFNPLKIPKQLQAALPFKSKPKTEGKRTSESLEQKRAVVLEPQERKMYALVQQLNTIRNEKVRGGRGRERWAYDSGSPADVRIVAL